MATSVTFICLKYPYQKLQVFDGIFSKGGARKKPPHWKSNFKIKDVWLELGRRRET